MINLLLRHCQVCLYSLGKATRTPLPTLMTTAVIGIALALPLGLHVLLQNVQRLTAGWDSAAQISLFMKKEATSAEINNLASRLAKRDDIKNINVIDRAQALAEFREYSGFADALDALADNPLPAVVVVYPRISGGQNAAELETLVTELRKDGNVDIAQLDMQWIQRLFALMDIARQGVWVLAILLALSVLLVVGNTIRLAIENQRDEIEITKLIGGTDAFIRRPFLYTGLWYGLFGGAIATLLVSLALGVIDAPVKRLALLYQSSFSLQNIDPETLLMTFACATSLGLAGSWIAVGRHLDEIEPS